MASLEGRLDYGTLMNRMSESNINNYLGVVKDYWSDLFNHSRKGISVPTLSKFFFENLDYYKDMIQLYKDKMVESGAKKLSADLDTQATQGALFDSLCFVYDSAKDTYSLVTMNFDLLYEAGVNIDLVKQVVKKNEQGLVKAYRIDVQYDYDGDSFNFKATNARDFDIDDAKDDLDPTKRFFLVPFLYVAVFMKYISNMFAKGRVLKITQLLQGTRKVRLVTERQDVLSQMCDIPSAVEGIGSRFFPLNGFFYAPAIGAPSTSSMVTNINVFDIDSLVIVPDDKLSSQYNICGIRKVENPVKDMVAETLVVNKLILRKEQDAGYFASTIESLPCRNKLLAVNTDNIGRSDISHYLHSLTPKQRESVYKVLDINEDIVKRERFLDSGSKLTESDLLDLKSVLKRGACRLVIQKSDCKLSSVLCTNSESVLASVYGKDYIKYYESFSYRFSKFYSWLMKGKGTSASRIMSALNAYGLPYTQSDIDFVVAILNINTENMRPRMEAYFADRLGVNIRSSKSQSSVNRGSSEDDMILVRTLSAYIGLDGKPVGYFRKIDVSKIVSGVVLY